MEEVRGDVKIDEAGDGGKVRKEADGLAKLAPFGITSLCFMYVCMYVQELPLRENLAMHTTRTLLRLDKYLKKGGQ